MNQTRARIVSMNADYLDEVAALERICFTDPWSKNLFVEELKNDLCAGLAALNERDQVIGYAFLRVVLDEGSIDNIAVHPDYRRQGIADKMIRVFINFARANHLAFLTLEVRASNYDAIAFYGTHGFRGMGRRKNYYEYPTEDAIIMTLYLNGEK